ncbi:MAG: hypothetical protein AABY83_12900 [Pseudomonadota bacterium]
MNDKNITLEWGKSNDWFAPAKSESTVDGDWDWSSLFAGTSIKTFTSPVINFFAALTSNGITTESLLTPAEQIRYIQLAFGINNTILASILEVERQTLLNWTKVSNPPKLQTRTKNRLLLISDIARQWRQRCTRPPRNLATSYYFQGRTLIDILSAEQIDEIALQSIMDALSKKINDTLARRDSRIRSIMAPPDTDDDRILRMGTSIILSNIPNED